MLGVRSLALTAHKAVIRTPKNKEGSMTLFLVGWCQRVNHAPTQGARAKLDPGFAQTFGVILVAPSYSSRRHHGSPALHLIGHPPSSRQGTRGTENIFKGDRQTGKGALACSVPPLRKRGQLKGYSGNERTLTQESVRRVCIISAKYLLSHLEMTSALHRPPLSTG